MIPKTGIATASGIHRSTVTWSTQERRGSRTAVGTSALRHQTVAISHISALAYRHGQLLLYDLRLGVTAVFLSAYFNVFQSLDSIL